MSLSAAPKLKAPKKWGLLLTADNIQILIRYQVTIAKQLLEDLLIITNNC